MKTYLPMSPVRLALSASLGSAFCLLIFLALEDYVLKPDLVRKVVVLTIVSIGVVAFVEPVLEQLRSAVGLSEHEHSLAGSTKRRVWIAGFFIIAFASLSHAALYDEAQNISGTIWFLIPAILIPAATTYAWIRQVQRGRAAAWVGGGVGAITGSAFLLLLLTSLAAAKATPLSEAQIELLSLINACLWGAIGLAGGLALDRGWGGSASQGIAIALLGVTIIVWIVIIAIDVWIVGIPIEFNLIAGDIFRALGWAGGIWILGPAADAVLRPRSQPASASIESLAAGSGS